MRGGRAAGRRPGRDLAGRRALAPAAGAGRLRAPGEPVPERIDRLGDHHRPRHDCRSRRTARSPTSRAACSGCGPPCRRREGVLDGLRAGGRGRSPAGHRAPRPRAVGLRRHARRGGPPSAGSPGATSASGARSRRAAARRAGRPAAPQIAAGQADRHDRGRLPAADERRRGRPLAGAALPAAGRASRSRTTTPSRWAWRPATGSRWPTTAAASTGAAIVLRRLRPGVVRLAAALPYDRARRAARRPGAGGCLTGSSSRRSSRSCSSNLVMLLFAFMTWFERRLIGRFQVRLGPEPGRAVRPAAADRRPRQADPQGEPDPRRLQPLPLPGGARHLAVRGAGGVRRDPVRRRGDVPGTDFTFYLWIADPSVALLLVFALGSFSFYGFLVGGWSSSSKYSLFGRCGRSPAGLLRGQPGAGRDRGRDDEPVALADGHRRGPAARRPLVHRSRSSSAS